MKQITSTTSTYTTVSGNSVEITDDKTDLYVAEQRDIEFMMDMAWTRYERKARFDYWANFALGMIVGIIIISIFN